MIKKNILAIALLGTFGLTNAADLENLRTTSYLNEPLRLQADVVGEGEIKLAAPTEYLRLNHPIPKYDLSIDVVERNGQKQLILVTTEEIESPALTLLLESNDENNRRQLFELPILLDFKPEAPIESVIEVSESVDDLTESLALNPTADGEQNVKEEKNIDVVVSEKPIELAEVPSVAEQPKAEAPKAKAEKSAPVVSKAKKKNNDLIRRYGPVQKGETLWSIANKVRPADVSPQKMIEIIKANNPSAFSANGVLLSNVTLLIPGQMEEVQHQFVKSDESSNSDRVAFIYELPEPPVKVTTIIPEPAPTQLSLTEPTEQSAKESVSTDQDFLTLAPELLDDVNIPDLEDSQEPTSEAASANNETSLETQTIPVESAQNVSMPELNQEAVPEEVNAPALEETIDTVTETLSIKDSDPVAETPVKRPVYIIPEPEPEPSIIELIFENIMYIGAGALVIILALLMIVLRRRKKDDEPKKPKQTKKFSWKKDKQKDTGDKSEDIIVPATVAATAVIAEEVVKSDDEQIILAGTEELNQANTVENVDFDLNFNALDSTVTPQIESVEVVSDEKDEALDFTIPTIVDASVNTEESADTEQTPEYEALNFDLSSTDNSNQSEVKTEQKSVSTSEDEEYTALDFTLSPSDFQPVDNHNVETVNEETEDYGGLDFVLSTDNLENSVETAAEAEILEDYGALDFTLSSDDSLENTQLNLNEPITKSAESVESLDFDLSSLSSVEQDDTSVEQLLKSHAGNLQQETFGENNPLFSSKNYPDAEEHIQEDTDSIEMPEYVSFPELLNDAESTLVEDIVETDKPKDFESLLEEQPSEFAELIETANNDPADKHAKIDLSFIADAKEGEAGAAFLESLDLSDEKIHGDPIDHSVKDGVAKSAESLEEIQAINTTLLDMPEIIETEIVDDNNEKLSENSIDIDSLETVSEAPVSVDDAILVEDNSIALEPETIKETVATSVQETETAPITSDNMTDVDFESEQVKLELAVAYMDFDKSLAKPLLDEVLRDGNSTQIAKAKELLANIN